MGADMTNPSRSSQRKRLNRPQTPDSPDHRLRATQQETIFQQAYRWALGLDLTANHLQGIRRRHRGRK